MRGGLVAFPTETVYGLGADASNPTAVAKIFAAKGRPPDHPLIVHLATAEHIKDWAREIPPAAWLLAEKFWPGPLTLILRRAARVPDAVTGGQDSVGLRVPAHPLAHALLAAFGGGIAAPSANRFGRVSPTSAQHVREELGASVDLILDGGACETGIESTILDLSRGRPVLLRPGSISASALEAVLGVRPQPPDQTAPRVSGALAAHYAPHTPIQLLSRVALLQALQATPPARLAVLARSSAPHGARLWLEWLALPDDAAGYAHGLYAALRSLDQLGCAAILVEAPPTGEAWEGVADRLKRAAAGSNSAGDEAAEAT